MLVKLFDIENDKLVPTEHCYTIKWLKNIMDEYSKDEEYLKIYAYLFYMTFPNPDLNPYFNMIETDKEEVILDDIGADFSTEDEMIVLGLEKCKEMFSTPTHRAFMGIKGMLDKLAKFMENTEITTGRDGNMNSIISAAKNFDQIRQSYKGAYKDLQDEQQSHVRGGKGMAYDQH